MPEPDKDPYVLIARTSRAARAWANMSTTQLATELGKKDRKYVERRENGQWPYSRGDLLRISEVTGVPIDFLTTGAGWTLLPPTKAAMAAAARSVAADRARKQKRNGSTPAKEAKGSGRNRNPPA